MAITLHSLLFLFFLLFWLFFSGVVGFFFFFFSGRGSTPSRFAGEGGFVSRLGAGGGVGDGLPETQKNKGGRSARVTLVASVLLRLRSPRELG